MKIYDEYLIKNATGVQIVHSDEMAAATELWNDIWRNTPPWSNKNMKRLNLGAAIANEMARLVTLEIKSEIVGGERAERMNEVYQEMIAQIRPAVEKACALGGVMIKPYYNGKKITFDFATPDMFYPTEFDSDGDMTGVVFVSKKTAGKTYYTKFEVHSFADGAEHIRNVCFRSNRQDFIGVRCDCGEVSEWSGLSEEVTVMNIKRPLFAYFKMPFANKIDSSPLGVSVFADSVELLEEADKQWTRFLWEYEGGELAIDADAAALKINTDGKHKMPSSSQRLFRGLNLESGSGDFYNVYNPTLRDASYIQGLDTILKRIEFSASLAYGTLSNPQNVDKTAEEIRSSKQRSYAAVSDIQKSLETALRECVQIIDVWVSLCGEVPDGEYEISFEWDDSIISDRANEYKERKELVTLGVLKPWELRAWYLGESEETAKAAIERDDMFGEDE